MPVVHKCKEKSHFSLTCFPCFSKFLKPETRGLNKYINNLTNCKQGKDELTLGPLNLNPAGVESAS